MLMLLCAAVVVVMIHLLKMFIHSKPSGHKLVGCHACMHIKISKSLLKREENIPHCVKLSFLVFRSYMISRGTKLSQYRYLFIPVPVITAPQVIWGSLCPLIVARAWFGPFPYLATFAALEVIKFGLVLVIATANASYTLHLLLILKFE